MVVRVELCEQQFCLRDGGAEEVISEAVYDGNAAVAAYGLKHVRV